MEAAATECRICRLPAEAGQSLRRPCKCAGTIGHVHEACLLSWLEHSKSRRCEVCGVAFRFVPLFSEDAPTSLTPWQLACGVARRVLMILVKFVRMLAVLAVWLGAVPLVTSWIWRLSMSHLGADAVQLLAERTTPVAVAADCVWGSFISAGIFVAAVAASSLRDILELDWFGANADGDVRRRRRRRRRRPRVRPEDIDGPEDEVDADTDEEEENFNANEGVDDNNHNDNGNNNDNNNNNNNNNNGGGGGVLPFDLDVPLDVLGWNGTWRDLANHVGVVLMSNALFIFFVMFLPFNAGRLAIAFATSTDLSAPPGIMSLWLHHFPFSAPLIATAREVPLPSNATLAAFSPSTAPMRLALGAATHMPFAVGGEMHQVHHDLDTAHIIALGLLEIEAQLQFPPISYWATLVLGYVVIGYFAAVFGAAYLVAIAIRFSRTVANVDTPPLDEATGEEAERAGQPAAAQGNRPWFWHFIPLWGRDGNAAREDAVAGAARIGGTDTAAVVARIGRVSKATLFFALEIYVVPCALGVWLDALGSPALLGISISRRVQAHARRLYAAPARALAFSLWRWIVGVAFLMHLNFLTSVIRSVIKPQWAAAFFLDDDVDDVPVAQPARGERNAGQRGGEGDEGGIPDARNAANAGIGAPNRGDERGADGAFTPQQLWHNWQERALRPHLVRIGATLLLYANCAVLFCYLPLCFAKCTDCMRVFPLRLSGSYWLFSHPQWFSLDILILHILLPFTIEHARPQLWVETAVRAWADAATSWLGIRDVVMPLDRPGVVEDDVPAARNEVAPAAAADDAEADGDIARKASPASSAAEVAGEDKTSNGIVAFAVMSWGALVISYATMLTLPIATGRFLHAVLLRMRFNRLMASTASVVVRSASASAWNATSSSASGDSPNALHDLYAHLLGSYALWVLLWVGMRCGSHLQGRTPQELLRSAVRWFASTVACTMVLALLFGAAPLALGLLVDLAVWRPLRFRANETVITSVALHRDWIIGAAMLKLAHRAIMALAAEEGGAAPRAPRLPLWAWARNWREKCRRLGRDGLERLDARWAFAEVVIPLLVPIATALAVPYATAHAAGRAGVALAALSPPASAQMLRFAHAAAATGGAAALATTHAGACMQALHAAVYADRYLVGERLADSNDS